MGHETQGTGYDPGAAGHELQGRKSAAPMTPTELVRALKGQSCAAHARQAADLIEKQAGEIEDLRDAATSATESLSQATSLMMQQGRWTNAAGYTTDVALHIDNADDALRDALRPELRAALQVDGS